MLACVGPVAQLVEQRIENPRVRGSIPRQATKRILKPILCDGLFCVWRYLMACAMPASLPMRAALA